VDQESHCAYRRRPLWCGSTRRWPSPWPPGRPRRHHAPLPSERTLGSEAAQGKGEEGVRLRRATVRLRRVLAAHMLVVELVDRLVVRRCHLQEHGAAWCTTDGQTDSCIVRLCPYPAGPGPTCLRAADDVPALAAAASSSGRMDSASLSGTPCAAAVSWMARHCA
jgi:hypothetical protein